MRRFLVLVSAVLVMSLYSGQAVEAAKFKLKNCTAVRAYVCVYKSDDNSLAIAAEAGGVQPGDRKTFKCDTNRCKAFIGFSKQSLAKALDYLDVKAGAVAGSALVGGFGAGVAAGTGTAGVAAMGAGAGAIVAVGVAAIAIDASAEMNKVCKKIIKQVKKDKVDKALKDRRVKGKYTLSAFKDADDNVYLSLDKGDDCPSN